MLQLHGHHPLLELHEHHAYLALVSAGEEVLGQLLRDGAAAARRALAADDRLEEHAEEAPRVDARMLVEAHILRGHEGVDEVGRYLVVGDVGAVLQPYEAEHLAVVGQHLRGLQAAGVLQLLE